MQGHAEVEPTASCAVRYRDAMVSMQQFGGIVAASFILTNSFDTLLLRMHDNREEAQAEQMRVAKARQVRAHRPRVLPWRVSYAPRVWCACQPHSPRRRKGWKGRTKNPYMWFGAILGDWATHARPSGVVCMPHARAHSPPRRKEEAVAKNPYMWFGAILGNPCSVD